MINTFKIHAFLLLLSFVGQSDPEVVGFGL